jgi:ribosome maturation factor RimP
VSAILDEKDPIDGEYSLEVSSPGVDRPLTKPEHFARFAGYEARIETDVAVDGRKRFKGILQGTDAKDNIAIDMEGTVYQVPFDAVSKAKLVLNDALLQEALEAQAEE